jgi:hypothetical protein
MFFNEVVGKKNKHKNRKAIWFEYIFPQDIKKQNILRRLIAVNLFLLNINISKEIYEPDLQKKLKLKEINSLGGDSIDFFINFNNSKDTIDLIYYLNLYVYFLK